MNALHDINMETAGMSTWGDVLFVFAGAIALVAAVLCISMKSPLRSAVALLFNIVAFAAIYLTLGAQMLATTQLMVYAGAIVVLFVFVIMLIGPGATLNANHDGAAARGLTVRAVGAALLGILFIGTAFQLGATQRERPRLASCNKDIRMEYKKASVEGKVNKEALLVAGHSVQLAYASSDPNAVVIGIQDGTEVLPFGTHKTVGNEIITVGRCGDVKNCKDVSFKVSFEKEELGLSTKGAHGGVQMEATEEGVLAYTQFGMEPTLIPWNQSKEIRDAEGTPVATLSVDECLAFGSISAVADDIFARAALPFEMISLLLLVGIIVALAVARGQTKKERDHEQSIYATNSNSTHGEIK